MVFKSVKQLRFDLSLNQTAISLVQDSMSDLQWQEKLANMKIQMYEPQFHGNKPYCNQVISHKKKPQTNVHLMVTH